MMRDPSTRGRSGAAAPAAARRGRGLARGQATSTRRNAPAAVEEDDDDVVEEEESEGVDSVSNDGERRIARGQTQRGARARDADEEYSDESDEDSMSGSESSGSEERGGTLSKEESRRQLAEQARLKKWIAFARQHTEVPLTLQLEQRQELQMTDRAGRGPVRKGDRTRGYALHLERLSGWFLPRQLQDAVLDGRAQVFLSLSLSFFHVGVKAFFGNTWMSQKRELRSEDLDAAAAAAATGGKRRRRTMAPKGKGKGARAQRKQGKAKPRRRRTGAHGSADDNDDNDGGEEDPSTEEDSDTDADDSGSDAGEESVLFDEMVYWQTDTMDTDCVAVLEIVASRVDPEKKITLQQFGIGWTMLPVFGRTDLVDASEGRAATSLERVRFHSGTPRQLLLWTTEQLAELDKSILDGYKLTTRLYEYDALHRVRSLIHSDQMIGMTDVVPGVLPHAVRLPESKRGVQHLACIGSSGKPGKLIPRTELRLCPPIKLSLEEVQCSLPQRLSAERELVAFVQRELAYNVALADTTGTGSRSNARGGRRGNQRAVQSPTPQLKIGARRLRIGYHNGHTIVGELSSVQLEVDEEEDDVLLVERETVPMPGYAKHPMYTLVMMLEYVLREAGAANEDDEQPAGGGTVGNANARDLFGRRDQAAPTGGAVFSNKDIPVVVGAAFYWPFDGRRLLLKNNSDAHGGDHDDGELDVELTMTTDIDVCRTLTSSMVVDTTKLLTTGRRRHGRRRSSSISHSGGGNRSGSRSRQQQNDRRRSSAHGDGDDDYDDEGDETNRATGHESETARSELMPSVAFDLIATDSRKRKLKDESHKPPPRPGEEYLESEWMEADLAETEDVDSRDGGQHSVADSEEEAQRKARAAERRRGDQHDGDRGHGESGTGDDDSDELGSLSESVVVGDSLISSLRLKPTYRFKDEFDNLLGTPSPRERDARDVSFGRFADRTGRSRRIAEAAGNEEWDGWKQGIQVHKSSTFAATATAQMLAATMGSRRGGIGGGGATIGGMAAAAAAASALGTSMRGAGKHAAAAAAALAASMAASTMRPSPADGAMYDVELEATDFTRPRHVVQFQFVSLRSFMAYTPRSVFFTFQFFTELAPPADRHLVAPHPSDADRTDPHQLFEDTGSRRARDPPPAIEFDLDMHQNASPPPFAVRSRGDGGRRRKHRGRGHYVYQPGRRGDGASRSDTGGTDDDLFETYGRGGQTQQYRGSHESWNFAEYLAHKTMLVDVWDSDSRLPLGTFAVPLHRLMRQRRASVRHTLECELVAACETAPSTNAPALQIREGGAPIGPVIGSVRVVLSNRGEVSEFDPPEPPLDTHEYGIGGGGSDTHKSTLPVGPAPAGTRRTIVAPTRKVRAKPLTGEMDHPPADTSAEALDEQLEELDRLRREQKRELIQQVLARNMTRTLDLYPEFGKLLYFEHTLSNPFHYEEKFLVDIGDPELKLVTDPGQWHYLRRAAQPCAGEIGSTVIEPYIFEHDKHNNVLVCLNGGQTISLAFTFVSFAPLRPSRTAEDGNEPQDDVFDNYAALSSVGTNKRAKRRQGFGSDDEDGKSSDASDGGRPRGGDLEEDKKQEEEDDDDPDAEAKSDVSGDSATRRIYGHGRTKGSSSNNKSIRAKRRTGYHPGTSHAIDVKFVSMSQGHTAQVLRVNLHPCPFVVDRVVRFFQEENTIMRRRVRLLPPADVSSGALGDGGGASGGAPAIHDPRAVQGGGWVRDPGAMALAAERFVHCVDVSDSKVVVEWAASGGKDNGGVAGPAQELMVRYRSGECNTHGDFYVLLYEDPYQVRLLELWHVHIQSRRRVDISTTAGQMYSMPLLVPGGRHERRVRCMCSAIHGADFSVNPDHVFHLRAGHLNRVELQYAPRVPGVRRTLINLVSVDEEEVVASWVVNATATLPDVSRTYDVDLPANAPGAHKRILYTNTWDTPKRYRLVSSDTSLLQPRYEYLELEPGAKGYMRLWFQNVPTHDTQDVLLFVNDDNDQTEESFLFKIRSVAGDPDLL